MLGDGGRSRPRSARSPASPSSRTPTTSPSRTKPAKRTPSRLQKDAETDKFGLTLKQYHLVDRSVTYPLYENAASNIGGPSGGLLSTLYVYNQLVTEDITRGLKIAGTGTINYDGAAGYIGGVKQKILTAYFAGVDVFFIPYLDPNYVYDNYVEALRVCEEVGIDPAGWLVGVASFQDVVDWLAAQED
ncbi:MAG: hypothetical protein MZU97_11690 [Bacillus subtilis]|nr:hypothetical protein [Bacillus subtilis]